MASIFTIESHPALVLFDSGASHSFMSMGFVEQHNLPLMARPYAYKIRTAGSQLFINTRTDTVSLVLATHTYRLQFMVKPGQVWGYGPGIHKTRHGPHHQRWPNPQDQGLHSAARRAPQAIV